MSVSPIALALLLFAAASPGESAAYDPAADIATVEACNAVAATRPLGAGAAAQ